MKTKSQIIGGNFEGEITLVCDRYKQLGFASIDKTPEPVKQIGKMDQQGRFTACYTKKAQPDFKGVIWNGRAICFEAKATADKSFSLKNISTEQSMYLERFARCGGIAFVLISISGNVYILTAKRLVDMLNDCKRSVSKKDFSENETVLRKGGFVDFLNVLK